MPRVIGIDPGTVSIDLCGLEDGRLFLDRSIPTSDALADPARFVRLLEDAGPVDLVAGPSGYGLPLTRARDATDGDLRLALLGPPGEASGIGGLGALLRALARPTTPRERIASEALIESAVKTAVALALSVPGPAEFVLSGRLAHVEAVSAAIRQRLDPLASTRVLDGFAAMAKQAAQGAALLADGLAGGAQRELVELLAIREARGSVLDHLYVVPREQAVRRLGGELA